ncbi:ras di-ras and rheb family members of small gtpase superfamily [Anaeramoeba flamelloides]|uniref:small monomeric GTPase n=1 Tax=Anaeramoeba flamelloides TaxID=1746091 RepID=A0AAV7ZHL9_9EUKA|nr:ras di-ras and rheb family members of small gtpase superfamily [Anaeramoeba flamelloides]
MDLFRKIILVGDHGVGKSSLKVRLDTNLLFDLGHEVEKTSLQLEQMDDQDFFLGILELLREESLEVIVNKYYASNEYFLFMYSVDSPDSFLKMLELYNHISKLKKGRNFKMVLMANKTDLCKKNERKVSKKKGQCLARKLKCPYYEISVKTGAGVDSSFVDMIHHFIISKKKQRHQDIVEDFKNLFHRQELTDCCFETKSGEKIRAHKLILESRLAPCKIKTIQELLLTATHESAMAFLEWAYTGYTHPSKNALITSMCEKISVQFKSLSGVTSVLKNLRNLYRHDSSKDFTLRVKKKSIKVHKLILVARSELFRGFFLSMDKSTKSVKDHSKNSIETMKSLIRFFYTNRLDGNKTKHFMNEIENSIEYFQLNLKSSLSSQLPTLKQNKRCQIM